MNIVYLVGAGGNHSDRELRLSLRSLRFVKDIGDVYIVGHKPEWCNNIFHIPFRDKHDYKDRNIIEKLERYCHQFDENDFIKMSDDFIFLKEYDSRTAPILHSGDYKHWIKQPQTNWVQKLVYTLRLYMQAGLDNPINYDSHTPSVINPKMFLDSLGCLDTSDIDNVTWQTWYGNYVSPEQSTHVRGILKYFYAEQPTYSVDDTHKYLSYSDLACSVPLLNFIEGIVGGKCKYEI